MYDIINFFFHPSGASSPATGRSQISKLLLKEEERAFTQFQVLHVYCLSEPSNRGITCTLWENSLRKVKWLARVAHQKVWKPDLKPSLHTDKIHILFTILDIQPVFVEQRLCTRPWRYKNESQSHTVHIVGLSKCLLSDYWIKELKACRRDRHTERTYSSFLAFRLICGLTSLNFFHVTLYHVLFPCIKNSIKIKQKHMQ